MEFTIEFLEGPEAPDVEITLSGSATSEGFERFTHALVGDPRFRAGLTLLVDVAGLDTSTFSDEALQRLTAEVVERDWYHPLAGVAIVGARGATFEDAHAYRAQLGGSRSHRQIFASRAEGVAWLDGQSRRAS